MPFFKTITKPKFVIALIALVLSAALLGVLVPQLSYRKPTYFEAWQARSPQVFALVDMLHLDRIYSSVWFLALVAMVLLSLGYSIYELSKRNLRRQSRDLPQRAQRTERKYSLVKDFLRALRVSAVKPDSAPEEERLSRLMRNRRYALKYKDSGLMTFSKNSTSRWGGVIFHSGLFLIIVAALLGLAFHKRGFAQVMEGGVFSGRDADFLSKDLGVFVKSFDPGFKIQLNKFQHTYYDTGDTKSFASSVSVIQGDAISDHTIAENEPLILNGVRVFQTSHYGYALSFLITKPTGERVVTNFLLDKPDRLGMPAVGKNDFETTNYFFDMTFYPDISKPSFYPTKPIVFLKVTEAGKPVFQGLMIPGEAIKVNNDTLQFMGIRNWTGLSFTDHTGAGLAYAGFAVALIGLILNYLLPYKEIRVAIGDGETSVSGWTKKYPALFEEELSAIQEELGKAFTAETPRRGENAAMLEFQKAKI